MSLPENTPPLKYDNLSVSSQGLSEIESKKVVLFIPSAEVEHITLKFGHSAHRPAVNMVLGILFVPIGILGLAEVFLHPAGMRYEIGLIGFGLIGGSLIFDTLKKRYFLEVRQKKTASRLILTKKASLEGLLGFCGELEKAHGYKITYEIDRNTRVDS